MHESVVCQEIFDIVLSAAEKHGLTCIEEIIVSAVPYSCLNEAELNFFFLMSLALKLTCVKSTLARGSSIARLGRGKALRQF